jgi:hypothetical protein
VTQNKEFWGKHEKTSSQNGTVRFVATKETLAACRKRHNTLCVQNAHIFSFKWVVHIVTTVLEIRSHCRQRGTETLGPPLEKQSFFSQEVYFYNSVHFSIIVTNNVSSYSGDLTSDTSDRQVPPVENPCFKVLKSICDI